MAMHSPAAGTDDCLSTRKLCRSYQRDGATILNLDAELPMCRESSLLNAYYGRLFRRLSGFCAEKLLPMLPNPEQPLKLSLTYRIRLVTPALLSLTLELTRQDKHTMPAARFGQVWSRSSWVPFSLQAFFPKAAGLRRQIRDRLRSEALERLRSGYCLYDPLMAEQAGQLYSIHDFYAAESGLVLFFQPLILGSAAEGIPEFLLPWDPSGPIPPEK